MLVTHRPDSPSARDVVGRFGPMIYGPTLLFALGEGAVVPLIPVIAAELGADVPTAALVVSALVVGQLCGNIPAGWAVARFGERITMAVAGGIALGAAGVLAIAPSLGLFALAVLLIGFCAAAFGLARHSFMTTRVPASFRARALSLLGGTFRLGMFVGPFVAAGLLAVFGDERAAVWFFAGCLVTTVLLVLLGPDPETQLLPPATVETTAAVEIAEDTGEPVTGSIPTAERVGVFRTMWRHRTVLARLGLAAASLSAVRSARQVILPLWGLSIGLDAQTIALVVGVTGAIDFALFYASGQVMDRFGRLWAALPAMLLMGLGFIALSLTHDLDQAAMWFALFAGVLGVGNGLSSGILLTLGADTAPKSDPAPYLGSWRTLTDAGGAVAPLLVSGIAAAGSLALATGAMGAIGLLGALAFVRWVPRFSPPRR
ncbi:MFS family permease [Microbacterium terrae]|uniref:Major Facilitator Superfamily protein n=1 Tax=Microbacterium terrae TaxID=69369 RepID=A0A0M2HK89_9MICO|nr:MFS transporter [Microbacterium terrae]KJL44786.1 Major Facilitator Superfamily protein [Microbacterium terrae]MBP1077036.1 MFS family permease [Microbacterium terrae]GLJ99629.1 MFS transporter [Microbacterium terrae]